jgi:hypothetical protein
MSERLATTTRDMLSVHSRLYDVEEQQAYNEARKTKALNLNKQFTPQVSEPVNNTSSPYQYTPYASELPLPIQPQTQPQQSIPQNIQSQPEHQSPQQQPMLQNQPLPQQQQQQQYDNTLTSTSFPIYGLNSSVDFNSCEFLQDSELFGQIVFDNTRNTSNINGPLSMNPVNYISPQPTVSYRQSSSVYQPNIASNSPMSNQYTDTTRPNYW